MVSIYGMIKFSIIFIIYHFVRKNFMKEYSKIQKFLHDFVLSNRLVNRSLFELEKLFYQIRKKLKIKDIFS